LELYLNWFQIFQAECYHYLFDAAIKLHQMGLDWSTPDHGPIQKVKGVLGCNGNVKMVVKAGMNNSDNGTGPLPVSS
jgi:methylthioribulose 1-phosphate dehydratase/enolase-phosphatase E1